MSSKIKNTATNQLNVCDVKFCVQYVKELLDKKEYDNIHKYIKKFFFRYKENIFFFDGTTFQLYSQCDAKKLISIDLVYSTDVVKDRKLVEVKHSIRDYLCVTDFMANEYIPTIDFTKPLIFTKTRKLQQVQVEEKYLNMGKPLNIDPNDKAKRTCTVNDGLQKVYDHIKLILCSNNNDAYNFVLNVIACTFAGRKLRKCIYMQSKERTGKGIIINGLLQEILGDRMFKTSSVEALTTYTKAFEGCCLVNFDELPVESNNWKAIGDKLKSLITEPTFDCRSMYQQSYVQKIHLI
mgnify:CR=1 FL=1